jgi:hypothetical protein
MAKVRKSRGEETFVGARGNDEDAPRATVPGRAEPGEGRLITVIRRC